MKIRYLSWILIFAISTFAQSEILTNAQVIEMSKIGLDKQIK